MQLLVSIFLLAAFQILRSMPLIPAPLRIHIQSFDPTSESQVAAGRLWRDVSV